MCVLSLQAYSRDQGWRSHVARSLQIIATAYREVEKQLKSTDKKEEYKKEKKKQRNVKKTRNQAKIQSIHDHEITCTETNKHYSVTALP